jgi:hypothetical protein
MPIKSELLPHFQFPKTTTPDHSNSYVHTFTNEGGLEDVLTPLKDKRAKKPGGIGLTVGSGAAYSLLTHLDLDGLIVVDAHPTVLDTTKLVGACIASSDSPEQAVDRMFQYLPVDRHRLDAEYLDRILGPRHPESDKFAREVEYLGPMHWTNPDVFQKAKQAIQETSITFANRDIRDMLFYYELADVLRLVNQPLTYVNFSNVHFWISSNRPLIEITQLLDPEGVIQFSNRGLDGPAPLTVRLAKSQDDFRRKTLEV